MRNSIRLIGISAVILAIGSFSFPARAEERDILELYRLAKGKDPTVSRAEARLESGKADKDIAWAAMLPRVSANASVRQMWHEVLYYEPNPVEGEYTGYSYGIGAAAPLFNLGSYYQLSVADAGIDSAEAAIHSVRQDLMVRLLEAYVQFLKARADEQLYRDELGRVGRVLEQAEAFLKEGTGDIIAVYEAKARVDAAAADLVKTEGQLRMAQQNLTILSGVDVDSVKDIAVHKSQGPDPADVEWWIETMKQRNPDLLRAKLDLSQAEKSTKAAAAAHYPTADGNGGYTVDKGSTFLPKVETRQWYAGVRINIPIYSGGDTSARTRRALASESERRAMSDDVQEKAIRRLKEAYLILQYNESLVAAYQRKHESAALQLKAVKKGREIGTRTAIDLLNSEQGYAVSKRDLSSALYDNLLRHFQLKAAAGILDEDDLAELAPPTPPASS